MEITAATSSTEESGYGDDTYIWKAGDGNDTVHNAIHNFWEGYIDAGNDTLKIQDARPEDISWRVQRNDLNQRFLKQHTKSISGTLHSLLIDASLGKR